MAKLPEYMVPTAFVQLESLPVNSDGELNRGKLPVPGRAGPESTVDFVAPRNDTEHALASIWRELLGIEQIGINSNFFDLGGHSFLITRLQNRLSTVFPQSISLVDLFQYPTIGALSERLGSTENLELKQRKEVSGQDRAELRNQLLQRRPGFTRETAGDRLFLEDDGIGIRSAGE